MKQTSKSSIFSRFALVLLSCIIALSTLSFSLISTLTTSYVFGSEANTFVDYTPTDIGLSNGDFANSASSFLGAPTSWTAIDHADKNIGATVMGVFDLEQYNTSNDNIETAKLTQYSEYLNTSPKSPFGTLVGSSNLANYKFLMINTTKETDTVAGYSSQSVTLSNSKFYKVSTWVKTGAFAKNGASFRLSGIEGQNIAFSDIQTVTSSDMELTTANNYGWSEYSFYIKTSSIESVTISIDLSVGDYYFYDDGEGTQESVNKNASGYAFFNNVSAEEISPTLYNNTLSGAEGFDKIQFVDLSLASANTGLSAPLDFTATGQSNWKSVMAEQAGVDMSTLVGNPFYDTNKPFDNDNIYGLEDAPIPATGKGDNSEILVLSSYDQSSDNFKTTAVGYESSEFTIEQYKYYRISAWVYTENMTNSGAGATISIRTNQINTANDDNYYEFTVNGCAGDSSNESRYGWREYAFYISGSMFKEYDIAIGFWLGRQDSVSGGIAMFSGIEFNTLTAEEFDTNSGDSVGGIVTIDGTYAETGVTNGNFTLYDSFSGEAVYPLAPYGWEYNTPSTVTTSNYSNSEEHMDTDGIISGVIVSEEAHFYANRNNYGSNVIRPTNAESINVLYMSNDSLTAFNYTSTPISIPENATGTITVRMMVNNIAGYGANIVFKNDDRVIGTIEKITSTNLDFKEFDLYLESASATEITVEIWLGLNERGTYNTNKLASGQVYVDSVSYVTDESNSVFYDGMTRYKKDVSNMDVLDAKLDYCAFSFDQVLLTEYDIYEEKLVKYPYLFTALSFGQMSYGIYDSTNLLDGTGELPASAFTGDNSKYDADGNLYNNTILYMQNMTETYSIMSLNRSYSLDAEAYYRVEVSLKTDIYTDSDTAQGVGIQLNGGDYKFENINHQTNTNIIDADRDNYRTYYFYIYAGSNTSEVSLAFTMGGVNNEACAGSLYINSINFYSITNSEYEEKSGNLHKDTDNILRVSFADYDTESDTESDSTTDLLPTAGATFDWLLVPSILFGLALIVFIVCITVRKIGDRRVKKATIHGTTGRYHDYDRRFVEEESSEDDVTTDTNLSDVSEQRQYEVFDDEDVKATASLSNKQKHKQEHRIIIETDEGFIDETADATETAYTDLSDEATVTENTDATTEEVTATESTEAPIEATPIEATPSEPETTTPVVKPASEEATTGFKDGFDD